MAIIDAYFNFINSIQYQSVEKIDSAIKNTFSDNASIHAFHPVNKVTNPQAIYEQFWLPFATSFPNLERRDDIVFEGRFNDKDWVCATGHYVSTFTQDWLGIPASGDVTFIRYGEFYEFKDNKIVDAYIIYDVPHVMAQAGYNMLPPSLGAEILIPGPATKDGIMTGSSDTSQTAHSLNVVEAMIAGLMQFDGKNLASMPIEQFWHPQFMWYGPFGTGSTRGLEGFQSGHQKPFLVAFPDRKGGNHVARLAHNNYVASTGWPSINATHLGSGWCGFPASNKRITMRVMDWWRVQDKIEENWVFIDKLDLLQQFGYDLLARLDEAVTIRKNRTY